MKKHMYKILFFALIIGSSAMAQENSNSEVYGKTLNLGIGAGYYGYLPVLHANYEIDVAQNFTLAPFISFYTYNHYVYHNNIRYNYHETAIPIGLKGTYYFDELLKVKPNWDLYLGASVGFAIVNSNWDNGYTGDIDGFNGANLLFANVHIGAEYHFNNRVGAFLDLSNGLSTIGFAIHTGN